MTGLQVDSSPKAIYQRYLGANIVDGVLDGFGIILYILFSGNGDYIGNERDILLAIAVAGVTEIGDAVAFGIAAAWSYKGLTRRQIGQESKAA